MALPINIHELIHGSTVEWECIEYKECWNLEIKQGIGRDQVAFMQSNNTKNGDQHLMLVTYFPR